MPEQIEGRVAIFEDNKGLMSLFKMLVTLSKHKVVIEASTLEEAREKIAQRVLDLGEIALDGVLLDGNLNGGTTNQDGTEITQLLREAPGGKDLFILSMSGTDLLIPGASMKLNKHKSPENPEGPLGVVQTLDAYLAASLGKLSETAE